MVADNPVRILDAFAEKLDPIAIGLSKSGIVAQQGIRQPQANPGGAPRFDDKVLLKLYLYGYLNKVRSSGKLEHECYHNMELRWVMHELVPNYHTIASWTTQRKNRSAPVIAIAVH